LLSLLRKDVDARDKPGHDGVTFYGLTTLTSSAVTASL